MYSDIAIIGGGASALAAAIEAAKAGASVALLERLPRVGKKILSTGNGRCNLYNSHAVPERYLGSRTLIENVLKNYGDTENFFRNMGLLMRFDDEGRAYPASDAASSVLDSLRIACAAEGVSEECGFEVADIKTGKGFTLISRDGKKWGSKRIIFAAGGKAAPKLGTDGSAFEMLKKMGITINKPRPALAPVKCEDKELRALKGLRVSAEMTAFCEGRVVVKRSGQVQFGDGELSGICVFDTAAFCPDEISLDLLPEMSEYEVERLLKEAVRIRKDACVEDAFTGVFAKRVAQNLIKRVSALGMNESAGFLSDNEIERMAVLTKEWRFGCCGSTWEKAQATMGGVVAGELDTQLQCRKCNGLYVCGEAVDVLGPCGGYNLHWAWSSGRCAGAAAAASLR